MTITLNYKTDLAHARACTRKPVQVTTHAPHPEGFEEWYAAEMQKLITPAQGMDIRSDVERDVIHVMQDHRYRTPDDVQMRLGVSNGQDFVDLMTALHSLAARGLLCVKHGIYWMDAPK